MYCILFVGHRICGSSLNWFLNLNLICETLWTGQDVACWFQCWEGSTGLVWPLALVLLMWKWMDLVLWTVLKSSFKMLGLTFSSELDWGSCIVSVAKTASKKVGALIRSIKFLSPEVALYLYKSTICPCMEYCFHAWVGGPSCYLELLDKLQERICRIIGPSLAASLESLAHHQNVASLSLFYRYYFGRCSSELAQLVPLPFFHGGSTCYSDGLHDFSVTVPRCYKDFYVNSFFPRTGRL